MKSILVVLLFALSLTAFAAKPPSSLTIAPNPVTLNSGDTQQFTASVTGVAWTTSAGTITKSGLFTAPTVTAQTLVIVTAKVKNVAGTAKVTVNPIAPPPPHQYTATTSWIAPIQTGVTGYNVYRMPFGGSFGLVASAVQDTTYLDTTVLNGVVYIYVVTAMYDNVESGYSNEATATIPEF
jgi:hypothetical protein